MRALIVTGPRQAVVQAAPTPAPSAGEVRLRVRACGVCGSDLNAWRGVAGVHYPLGPGLPGHEVFGEVAALGPGVVRLRIGQPVTGLAQAGFAEYVLARADQVLSVDGLVLGEPLACAANVVRRAKVGSGDAVAVVGFGYLAALVVQLLDPRRQQHWVAVSRRADSRALALRLGAAAAYGFDEVPAELWDRFAVVIEAAGKQQALDYASWLVAYGGRLVIAGYHADGPRTVNLQTWNWKGIDVINAHERQPAAYMRGLREGLTKVRRHGLDLAGLVTHRWSLDGAADAFAAAEERPPGYIKAIIEP